MTTLQTEMIGPKIVFPKDMLAWFIGLHPKQAKQLARKVKHLVEAVSQVLGLQPEESLECIVSHVPTHPRAKDFLRFHFRLISPKTSYPLDITIGITLLHNLYWVEHQVMDLKKAIEQILHSALQHVRLQTRNLMASPKKTDAEIAAQKAHRNALN